MAHMVGGFGAEKTDAELLALFTTPEVLSAVNALLSAAHAKIVPLALKTQVVRAQPARAARSRLLFLL